MQKKKRKKRKRKKQKNKKQQLTNQPTNQPTNKQKRNNVPAILQMCSYPITSHNDFLPILLMENVNPLPTSKKQSSLLPFPPFLCKEVRSSNVCEMKTWIQQDLNSKVS